MTIWILFAAGIVSAQTLPLLGVGVGGRSSLPVFINSGGCSSAAGASCTTSTINMTGANFLIMACSGYNGAVCNPSDSSSNTWISLTKQDSGATNCTNQLWYVPNATVGSSQTFTAGTAAGTYFPSLSITGFSGIATSPAITQNGASIGNIALSLSPGSVTGLDNGLVVTGLCFQPQAATITINLGFTAITQQHQANAVGTSLGYLIQAVGAAVNPTWTSNQTNALASPIAAIR